MEIEVFLQEPTKQIQKAKAMHLMAAFILLLMGTGFALMGTSTYLLMGGIGIFESLLILYVIIRLKDGIAKPLINQNLRIMESISFLSFSVLFFMQHNYLQMAIMFILSIAYAVLIWMENKTLVPSTAIINNEGITIEGGIKEYNYPWSFIKQVKLANGKFIITLNNGKVLPIPLARYYSSNQLQSINTEIKKYQ